MTQHTGRPFISILVSLMCATTGLVPAQDAPKPALKILVIGAEGSINNVKQRTAREPVVEVQDENNRPVAGAVVFFKAPDLGASGTFANNANSIAVTTNAQGRATARFMPNQSEGDMQIQVTASFAGMTASTVITMRNVAGAGPTVVKSSTGAGKIVAIVAGIGAAAAVGIVVGTRGGNNPAATAPSASPTTITAGSGTVGPRP